MSVSVCMYICLELIIYVYICQSYQSISVNNPNNPNNPILYYIIYIYIHKVHERTIQTDFLMIILKDLLQIRTNLKIILMSATLNANIFSNYFKNLKSNINISHINSDSNSDSDSPIPHSWDENLENSQHSQHSDSPIPQDNISDPSLSMSILSPASKILHIPGDF